MTADWADGGNTNINDLGLACPPDNRSVGPGGWTTAMNTRTEVEWTPPPDLDTGQTRINTYHRPEALLRPPDEPDNTAAPSESTDGNDIAEPEPSAATTNDHADEPGGPAPPDNQAA